MRNRRTIVYVIDGVGRGKGADVTRSGGIPESEAPARKRGRRFLSNLEGSLMQIERFGIGVSG